MEMVEIAANLAAQVD